MAGERVLVVDDRRDNIEFVVDYVLKPNGYEALTAEDGAEGLRKALTEKPDLIIMDHNMPKMTGLQVMEALKEKRLNIPVILMTFHGSESLAVQFFRLGVKDYLIKPFTVEEMLESIDRALTEVRLRKERDQALASLVQANRQLGRRVKELNILYGIGKSVTSLLDLEKLLGRVVEAAVYISGAEEGFLMLVDEETGELYVRAAQGPKEKYPRSLKLRVEDSIADGVIRTGEAVMIGGSAQNDLRTAYLVKALLSAPLKTKGKVIGVLSVANKTSDKTFTDSDLYLLSALADYAAIAIENAQLFTAVKSERSKLETIIGSTEDAVIVTDSEMRVLLLNKAARRAFGLKSAEVTNKPIAQVVKNESLINLFVRSISSSQAQRGEIPLEDGRTLNANLTPIPGVGYVAVMQDITYLKELDRMKSEFVSTVSHDLRSPLTTIKGFAQLLPKAGPLTPQQQEFSAKILKGVENITELIEDLLDLGKIEAGVGLEMDVCQLDAIINKVVEDLRSQAEAKRQRLDVELPPQLPPVLGNEIRLGQVVANLVSNAIKYTPDGGLISVRVSNSNDQIVVSVQDTGFGIPLADQPYIFDKFYRVQSEETDGISGTGLGLAIVKSVVERHNGRVWVESEPGVGSTFTFILPKYDGQKV
ncbi:MAG TPA: response regulator [Anaerolineae bacterium]|nr:response regulator [Anaerolineae bacterium]